jgi:phosphoglycerate dehydrogenase-like enzyme
MKELNIPLYVNQGVNSRSVAEHTMSLILASLKRLPIVHNDTVNGIWKKQEHGVQSRELYQKTVGIIGMGHIGSILVSLLKGFNCKIIYYDKYRLNSNLEDKLCIKYANLNELFSNSDIVTLHCPLTEETRKMIQQKEFEIMKKNAILINTARGELIDEDALYNALKNGTISFAGLDVFSREPVTSNNKLLTLKNIVLTSHMGGLTYESFSAMMEDAINNIVLFHKGELDRIESKRVI